jgi:hypothetical protein
MPKPLPSAFAFHAAAALVLGAAAFGSSSAHAEQFALFVYETPADFAARNDPTKADAYWGGFAALGAEMNAAGIVRGGGPLAGPDQGVTVTVRDGQSRSLALDSGPQTLSGWFVIDVADRAEAERWAARVPAASTARIEVRPVLDLAMGGPAR